MISGCYRLEYITLTEGIESIGDECFSGCEKLHNVTIP
ncbi:MAG: leucine-rich repeat protein, partial [Ruminococcus sp.]|nr:leucine-rich repeat protein [Ruminococcus sp.]